MSARRLSLFVAAVAALAPAPWAAGDDSDGLSPESKAAGFKPLAVEPRDVHECTGRYGGTLSWGIAGDVDTFHPLLANSATSVELKALVFDSLVAYDNAKWDHRPWLAWKWDHSDDWLTWNFHLRKGVKWSDGEPFTADDVLFSFATVYDDKHFPNSDVAGFKVGDAAPPKLEKVDDYTVRFHCFAVDVGLLDHIATVSIVPKHLWGDKVSGDQPAYASAMSCDHPEQVVGTGAFRIVEYKSAERIVYERNPYCWMQDQEGKRLPYVDRAIVLLVADMATETLKFLNKEFDLLNDIKVDDYDQFKAKEKEGWFTLHRLGPHLNTYWMSLNQHPGKDKDGKPFVEPYKLAWFQDVRFRRAVSHAVDRDSLVKNIMDGKGIAIYGQTTKANKQWYVETTRYAYDVDAAGKLLDEMGLKERDADGIRKDAAGHRVEFDLATNVENKVRVNMTTQIKADLARVGISVNLRQIAIKELIAQLSDVHKWEGILLGWGSAVPPTPLMSANILKSSERLHANYPLQEKPATQWEADLDKLFDQMSNEPDPAKHKDLWTKISEIDAQNLGIIYLVAPNCYASSRKRVHNVKASVLRPSTWWNFEELWVEEK